MEARIVLDRVVVGYPNKELIRVNGVEEIGRGLHVLVGSNGSGKTTLLKTIAGLHKPLRGRIIIDGEEPYKLKRRRAARLIGYTWQNPYYGFIEARVIDEVKFILDVLGVEGDWSIVEKLVPPNLYERDPYTLSGGEAKRVSIASVLVADQPIWLLDEPFNDLDYEGTKNLLEILEEKRSSKIIIIATHLIGLMDHLKPDKYLLIRGDQRLEINDWDKLTDDKLVNARVLPRRMFCVYTC